MEVEISEKALGIGKRLIGRKHASVLAGDREDAEFCSRHYDRLLQTLNKGTNFGCRAGPNAVGPRLEQALAAPDGETPMWGQSGRMFVSVNGMPCVVEVEGEYGIGGIAHFSFHACAFDRPFISETGYRSDFVHRLPVGKTVREAAEDRLRFFQFESVRDVAPDSYTAKQDEFANVPFVVDGMRTLAASLPASGTRVWVRKQIGLITEDVHANEAGKINVALFSIDKSGRHRDAPLSQIVHRTLWPWEARPVTEEEFKTASDSGKHLTIGMIRALAQMAA
ncbi:hypothetical protein P9281_34660 [Caballeronia sp. LP003]|uniref:hypothetical protein n=1 Tax=Caballeronia sp. LP003 TaxID=3038551 RepID=UPI00285AAAB9|nr:hypothetical protein [Caballeronia sp. LP003]MDR5791691.1 hypothetical protein [Caballeronia sp. LP003]